MRAVGSNLVLLNQILSIEAKKPLMRFVGISDCLELRRALEDVRTLWAKQDPELLALIHDIRQLTLDCQSLDQRPVDSEKDQPPQEAAA